MEWVLWRYIGMLWRHSVTLWHDYICKYRIDDIFELGNQKYYRKTEKNHLSSTFTSWDSYKMFNLHPATWGLIDPRSPLPFYNSYVYHDIVVSSRNSFRVHIPYMAIKFSQKISRGRVTFWGSSEYYTLLATWGLLDPRIIECGKTVNLWEKP